MRKLLLLALVSFLSSLSASCAWRVGLTDQHLKKDWVTVETPIHEGFVKAGFVPVIIPCSTNVAVLEAQLDMVDCLVLTGGADVEPWRYGETRHPNCGASDPLRDAFEFALIAAARRRRLPIVGICRGVQILNVAFGGTLWQDIPSEFPRTLKVDHGANNYLHPEKEPAGHTVRPVAGTRFAEAIGTADLAVNTVHHQAVRDVAPGFRVTARAPDGVIEGIEAVDYPAFGVQFHPEALVARAEGNPTYDYARLLRLLRSFPKMVCVDFKANKETKR